MDFIEIEINNWSQYNTRKEYKSPRWFALSNRILESPSMWELSAEEFRAWIYILCQASQKCSSVVKVYFNHANKACSISKRTLLSAIAKLEKDQSIQCHVRGANAACPITVATEQNKTEQNTTPKLVEEKIQALGALWNTKVSQLAKVKKLEGKRRDLCVKHHLDYQEGEWAEIFARADRSSFLTGGGAKGWKASFDWVLKNANRIDEGEFDDKQARVKVVL